MTMQNTLRLDAIRLDGATQPRTCINQAVVDEYGEAIMAGDTLPPLDVFHDGADWWLADGFHRWHAHKQAGAVEVLATIHAGTQREAVLYAMGANAHHGLRRSNDDKRKAVRTLLEDAEWGKWSDRAIAKACRVGHTFVAKLREDLTPSLESDSSERTYTTKHGTEATMNVAGQRKAAQERKAPAATESSLESVPVTGADDGPSTGELLEDLQRDVERLTADLKAVEADDAKAEVLKARRMLDNAQRQQSDAMERAAPGQRARGLDEAPTDALRQGRGRNRPGKDRGGR